MYVVHLLRFEMHQILFLMRLFVLLFYLLLSIRHRRRLYLVFGGFRIFEGCGVRVLRPLPLKYIYILLLL